MSVFYNPSIVTDGLVFQIDAANIKSYPGSGTSWNDLSGNFNDATIVNTPTYSTLKNGAFTVDGVGTNYFSLDSKISLINLNAGTVGGWVRFNEMNLNSTNYVYVSYGGNAYGGGFLLQHAGLNGDNDRLEFSTWGGSITGVPRALLDKTNSMPYQGQDIHMIATWTTSEIKLYINGQLRSTASTNAAIPARTTLRISSEGGRARGINGNVYTCSIYNRALSAQEILQNYNATKGRYL